jgi:ArsR family transcriptional regulator
VTAEPRPADAALPAYRAHADLCKVLTDPKRLMVLDALRAGERSVGELAAVLGVALPNVSQHLAVLRSAGLVDGVRAGTTVRYRLVEPDILEACDIIHAIVERRLETRLPATTLVPADLPPAATATNPVLASAHPR